ncbi:tetratricopeptide repeat protein [Falcatimonas sp. MSJ-15]|uniref:tetratricopeptide repeat protein n=1 Tax=Falcatimonas sp. MSJ-15 TaxID=2841515 RepID=UPI001C118CBB|nr:tetratricopeptide repeat protein [Falcatimonas sp. MSJ-15]MBU5470502.1 tetratricopeptide repeat protein [Falcatimonas sp. MSJ-15]
MDKYEFNIKLEQIKKLRDRKDYETCAKIADTIEWRKVKQWQVLKMAAECYEAAGKYEEARDLRILGYNKNMGGKSNVYKMVELYVKTGDFDEAMDLYNEYVENWPKDIERYMLLYTIKYAKDAPYTELIDILEKYLAEDLDEKIMYELCELYEKTGQIDKCIKECDELFMWFGEGVFVDAALEMKKAHATLTPRQQDAYDTLQLTIESAPDTLYDEDIYDEDANSFFDFDETEIKDDKREEVEAKRQISDISDRQAEVTQENNAKDMPESVILQENIAKNMPESVTLQENNAKNMAESVILQENIAKDMPESASSQESNIYDTQSNNMHDIPETVMTQENNTQDISGSQTAGEYDIDNISENVQAGIQEEEYNLQPEAEADRDNVDVKVDEPKEIKEPLIKSTTIRLPDPEEIRRYAIEQQRNKMEELRAKNTQDEDESQDIDENIEQSDDDKEFIGIIHKEAGEFAFVNEQEERSLNGFEEGEVFKERRYDNLREFMDNEELSVQIINLLKQIDEAIASGKGLSHMNIIIAGNGSVNRQELVLALVKSIFESDGSMTRKIARINGDALNKKGIVKVKDKLSGTILIIESAGSANMGRIDELTQVMTELDNPPFVILEDSAERIDILLRRNPLIQDYFGGRIELMEYSVNDMVTMAKSFAHQKGYGINDKALLQLYLIIDTMHSKAGGIDESSVENIIDKAIANSDKKGVNKVRKRLPRALNGKGVIMLTESDFK